MTSSGSSPPAPGPLFLVVAGEASGDLHAAAAVQAAKERCPGARFIGMGGERMRGAGVETVYDASEISAMGITEVIGRLPRILRALRGLVRLAAERRPDAALLVDLPDFNLRLAKRLKRLGVPVIYYVSPMVWAWRARRTRMMARVIDRLLCIYPFEEPFLRARGVQATFVGNPLLEEAPPRREGPDARAALGLDRSLPTVALLPGSRESEVRRLYPAMLEAAALFQAAHGRTQLVVPIAPTIDGQQLERLARGYGLDVTLSRERTIDILAAADLAVVASGTATLEAMLAGRPMVVVYRVSWLTWLIGRLLVKVAHVAIVNLLAGRAIVPELLQRQMTPKAIASSLRSLWLDAGRRREMLDAYREVRERLGGPGASAHVAKALLEVSGPRGRDEPPPGG
ncbi:MAG: lipid-A-disaccharide synthase [Deltaproteobacteria bacterium]